MGGGGIKLDQERGYAGRTRNGVRVRNTAERRIREAVGKCPEEKNPTTQSEKF